MSYTLISSITGQIESMTTEYVDISASQFTLRIMAPTSTLEKVGPIGSKTSFLKNIQAPLTTLISPKSLKKEIFLRKPTTCFLTFIHVMKQP